ncbi:MAG TPA: ribonuclease III family protein [Candidatus Borkfalkia faecigallinarum]|uniref:Ribonuclease 3 n=1 Tax=Candidatus Borkfalkia faecigallinarum TaxID=2838509 RepID=A0A9D2AQB4_9FIRM|nr:ribonuclease III family protein [Candidatus Borkfalkia faecigallinarum]
MPDAWAEAERRLGYTFADRRLLATCFTHASYASEHGCASNERLEFLGDAVLDFLVADELYAAGGASEGEMTARRIRYVAAQPLAEAVRRAGLDAFLLHVGAPGEKAVSSLFEALTAGIYLDGGLDAARAFVRAKLLVAADSEPNYKGDLQEWLQARGLPTAAYETLSREGATHAPLFTVRAAGGGESAVGRGGSLRAAQKDAAKKLLDRLRAGAGGEE